MVALTAALSHHQDVGGMVPSSMPAQATELFQEGLVIPPLRLYEAGVVNEDVLRLICRNVRMPQSFRGDLDGQVAAVLTGRKRLIDLIDDIGFDLFAAATVDLLDRSERMTRAAIAEIPPGTYRFHDYLDHDGVDLDRKIRIEAAITVGDGDFTVDFTGTDAQTRGPVNGPPSTAFSAVAYVLRALSDSATPINGGSERPIKLVLPPGTIVNPTPPAPVSLRAHLGRRIVDVLLGALVEALPERIPACSASINGAFSYAGIDPLTGRAYAITDTNIASGMGALHGQDGTDVLEMHTTNLASIPTEALELGAPGPRPSPRPPPRFGRSRTLARRSRGGARARASAWLGRGLFAPRATRHRALGTSRWWSRRLLGGGTAPCRRWRAAAPRQDGLRAAGRRRPDYPNRRRRRLRRSARATSSRRTRRLARREDHARARPGCLRRRNRRRLARSRRAPDEPHTQPARFRASASAQDRPRLRPHGLTSAASSARVVSPT